jgi:hypothetical protein
LNEYAPANGQVLSRPVVTDTADAVGLLFQMGTWRVPGARYIGRFLLHRVDIHSMRIRSPFKDYYDSAMSSGSDPSRVFVREPESRKLKLERDGSGIFDRYSRLAGVAGIFDLRRDRVETGVCAVVFCGRVYKALRVHRTRGASDEGAVEERVFYACAEAQAYLENRLGKERMNRKRNAFLEYDNPLAQGTLNEGLARFFEHQGSDELMEWSVENRTAIAVLHVGGRFYPSLLEINPPLKAIQFYRLFGPAEAFQELDMFWGGVLAPESRPTVGIADNDRIAQHGFNERSFRKDPSKKR